MIAFEVSAKLSTNLAKMMYTAISELSYFEQFESDREKILVELEHYNDVNVNVSVLEHDKREKQELQNHVNGINIKPLNSAATKKKACC